MYVRICADVRARDERTNASKQSACAGNIYNNTYNACMYAIQCMHVRECCSNDISHYGISYGQQPTLDSCSPLIVGACAKWQDEEHCSHTPRFTLSSISRQLISSISQSVAVLTGLLHGGRC